LVIEKFQLPIVETNFDSKNLVAKRNGWRLSWWMKLTHSNKCNLGVSHWIWQPCFQNDIIMYNNYLHFYKILLFDFFSSQFFFVIIKSWIFNPWPFGNQSQFSMHHVNKHSHYF
jgi:hypothetical protein